MGSTRSARAQEAPPAEPTEPAPLAAPPVPERSVEEVSAPTRVPMPAATLPTPAQPAPPAPTPAPATSGLSPAPVPASLPGSGRRLGAGMQAPVPTYEPPPPRFGSKGMVLPWGYASAFAREVANSEATSSGYSIGAGADWFVWRSVSLGLGLNFGSETRTRYESDGLSRLEFKDFGAELRVGLAVPLWNRVALYPIVSGFVGWMKQERALLEPAAGYEDAPRAQNNDGVSPGVSLAVPIVVQVAPHFLMGAGPMVAHYFGSESNEGAFVTRAAATRLRASVMFGGVFGGDEATPAAPVAEALPEGNTRPPSFGDRGTVILGGETYASVSSWLWNDGAYEHGFGIGPSFDYFLAPHFALGVLFGLDYVTYKNVYLQQETRGHRVALSGGIRASYDLRLSESVSLFPRVSFGASYDRWYDERGGLTDDVSSKALWGAIDVPFLFHVATHYFVGLGPSVSHDFSRQYDPDVPGPDLLGTVIRAKAFVGGWL